MADNKRWFKVWNSILTDPSFLDLPLEKIGQWTLLGALISLHGENGKITLSMDALEKLLRCNFDDKNDNDCMLPNVVMRRLESDNGRITVIMNNWSKYQLDSNGYERLKRYRNKQNDNGVRGDKNKTKNNTNKREDNNISDVQKYGEFKNVKLSSNEYEKLKNKLNDKTDFWIKTLDEGIEYKGYKYKSHYLAILKWVERETTKRSEYL